MSNGRYGQTATLLGSGNVLVAGQGADLYALDLGGVCATASDCQNGFCVDGVCCNSACNAGPCDACSVAAGAAVNGTCALLTGIACDDGNPCTQSDTCQAGVCTGSSPVVCAAQDQCHSAGACDPVTGCSNPAEADGTACDDSSLCTQGDACQAGICTGSNPVVCAAQDKCHSAGACNPATGICSNPAKVDGTACDDGDPCTQSGACQAGVCTGGNPVVCTALDTCHIPGQCDPATGVCTNIKKPDTAACDDGNACTQTDTCQAGRRVCRRNPSCLSCAGCLS